MAAQQTETTGSVRQDVAGGGVSAELAVNQAVYTGKVVHKSGEYLDAASGILYGRYAIEGSYRTRGRGRMVRHVNIRVPVSMAAALEESLSTGREVTVAGAVANDYSGAGRGTGLDVSSVQVAGSDRANSALLAGRITGSVEMRKTRRGLMVTRFSVRTCTGDVSVQLSSADALEKAISLSRGTQAVVMGRLHTYQAASGAWILEVAADQLKVS